MRRAAALLVLGALAAGAGSGCTADRGPEGMRTAPPASPATTPAPTAPGTSAATPPAATASGSSSAAVPAAPVRPADFEAGRAMSVVRHLAGTVGPRHGTSPAFARAARWAAASLRRLGYEVRRQQFDVPGGVSWGVPVRAGSSLNVVASPRGFDPTRPHLVVGAHLDTVPRAPGAEDNASGVGVLLAAAEAAAGRRTRLPVVWVAFGAEEPRGPGDDDHHYGSRAYVAAMGERERGALRAMVSLDRVGVGDRVPVGSARLRDPVQQALLAAARRTGVPAVPDPFQRSSDHWSFARAGLAGARLGSTPYAAYHSSADLPPVVDPLQLGRTGRLLLAWLAP